MILEKRKTLRANSDKPPVESSGQTSRGLSSPATRPAPPPPKRNSSSQPTHGSGSSPMTLEEKLAKRREAEESRPMTLEEKLAKRRFESEGTTTNSHTHDSLEDKLAKRRVESQGGTEKLSLAEKLAQRKAAAEQSETNLTATYTTMPSRHQRAESGRSKNQSAPLTFEEKLARRRAEAESPINVQQNSPSDDRSKRQASPAKGNHSGPQKASKPVKRAPSINEDSDPYQNYVITDISKNKSTTLPREFKSSTVRQGQQQLEEHVHQQQQQQKHQQQQQQQHQQQQQKHQQQQQHQHRQQNQQQQQQGQSTIFTPPGIHMRPALPSQPPPPNAPPGPPPDTGFEEPEENPYDDIASIMEKKAEKKQNLVTPLSPDNSAGMEDTPPPLPKLNKNMKAYPAQEGRLNKRDEQTTMPSTSGLYSKKSTSMSLQDFISEYQNELPLQVRITQGIKSNRELSQGSMYNIHFIEEVDVVEMRVTDNVVYQIPLNSAIECGIIYNPTNRVEDAIQGFLFDTAGEIVNCGEIPQLVCALKAHETSTYESSVQVGDVICIKAKNSKSIKKLLKGKMVSCIHVRSGDKKKLPETCHGSFSTAPTDTKLHLPELTKYLPLPQHCILYYNGANSQEISSLLPAGIVTLEKVTTATNVIVTKANSPSASGESLMELFVSPELMVEGIWPESVMDDKLCTDTKLYYETFSPININRASLLVGSKPSQMRRQATLLGTIRYDNSCYSGVRVLYPARLNRDRTAKPIATVPDSAVIDDGDDGEAYEYPEEAMRKYREKEREEDSSSEYDIPQNIPAHAYSSDAYNVPKGIPANLPPAAHSKFPSMPGIDAIQNQITSKSRSPSIASTSPTPAQLGTSAARPSNSGMDMQAQLDSLKAENKSLKSAVEKLEKCYQALLTKTGMV